MPRRIWCECLLPLYRGSSHLLTRRQKKRHKQNCLERNIPFTRDEAASLQAAQRASYKGESDRSLSVESSDASKVELDLESDYNNIDDADEPTIQNWLHTMREEEEVISNEVITDIEGESGSRAQILQMFDAFIGTPREKLKKMRSAIQANYDVDIGDPIGNGRRTLETSLGDMIQPMFIDCCADGCVAFVGRLVASIACPSCNKKRYNHQGRSRYQFQYIPLTPGFVSSSATRPGRGNYQDTGQPSRIGLLTVRTEMTYLMAIGSKSV